MIKTVLAVALVAGLAVPVGGQDAAAQAFDSAGPQPDTTISRTDTAQAAASVYPLSPERKEKLIAYSRFTMLWRFADFAISVGVLLLILFTGFSARLCQWAQVARKRFLVTWLYLVLVLSTIWLLGFPFDFYRNYVVESRFGFMNQTFTGWFSENVLSLALSMLLGIVPAWFLYWLIGRFRKWWLSFSIGAIPFMVFFIVIAPVVIAPLFNKFEPLKDKQLETTILNLADKAGIEGSDVFQVNASKQSTKVNAYVTGLFGTKRIVLYDNLINNFTTDEIRFVMGHEMGHYVMHHVWWGLLLAIVLLLVILWLTNLSIHGIISRFHRRWGFDRLSDIASLPLVLLYLTVISFLLQPVMNGVSRHFEHRSDVYGMDITSVSGETAAIAFDKLSALNLSDPDPNPIIEFWFYSHPALQKRMAFVRAYRPVG
ncbi:MAG: M48 family metallopeptidase [Candidatus Zixiibacteriota bacterium]